MKSLYMNLRGESVFVRYTLKRTDEGYEVGFEMPDDGYSDLTTEEAISVLQAIVDESMK